ncbi:hypothetical protein ACW5XF_05380 [Aeromonas lusitana]|uniref:hypothetical protein n=1 Tax=Aeromonas lusitana TaxID=931529 RepID=UPI0012FDCC06|nr:hypothetical protein [Aeromonas lusitana]
MVRALVRCLVFFVFLSSPLAYACGDNANSLVQGPFKDSNFNNGTICFQKTSDERDIEFHLEYDSPSGVKNILVDTFYYSDAPVELMSVFFVSVNKERNVAVLLRWNVEYISNGVKYPYFYEIKTYNKVNNDGYQLNLNSDDDSALSGYQIIKDGVKYDFPLDNANKIKRYIMDKYTS